MVPVTTVPIPNDTELPKLLQDNGVKYAGRQAEEPNLLLYILVQSLPFLLILACPLMHVFMHGGHGGHGGGDDSRSGSADARKNQPHNH